MEITPIVSAGQLLEIYSINIEIHDERCVALSIDKTCNCIMHITVFLKGALLAAVIAFLNMSLHVHIY